jgi:hypothetical protein
LGRLASHARKRGHGAPLLFLFLVQYSEPL